MLLHPFLDLLRFRQLPVNKPLPGAAGTGHPHGRVSSDLEQAMIRQGQGMGDTIHKAAETDWAGVESLHLVAGLIKFDEGSWLDRACFKRLFGLVDALERHRRADLVQDIVINLEVKILQTNLEGVFVLWFRVLQLALIAWIASSGVIPPISCEVMSRL